MCEMGVEDVVRSSLDGIRSTFDCAICVRKHINGVKVVLPCGHEEFCRAGIERNYFEFEKDTCPLCRAQFNRIMFKGNVFDLEDEQPAAAAQAELEVPLQIEEQEDVANAEDEEKRLDPSWSSSGRIQNLDDDVSRRSSARLKGQPPQMTGLSLERPKRPRERRMEEEEEEEDRAMDNTSAAPTEIEIPHTAAPVAPVAAEIGKQKEEEDSLVEHKKSRSEKIEQAKPGHENIAAEFLLHLKTLQDAHALYVAGTSNSPFKEFDSLEEDAQSSGAMFSKVCNLDEKMKFRSAVLKGYVVHKIMTEKGKKRVTEVYQDMEKEGLLKYTKDGKELNRSRNWLNDRYNSFKLVREFPIIIYYAGPLNTIFDNHKQIKEKIRNSSEIDQWKLSGEELTFDMIIGRQSMKK